MAAPWRCVRPSSACVRSRLDRSHVIALAFLCTPCTSSAPTRHPIPSHRVPRAAGRDACPVHLWARHNPVSQRLLSPVLHLASLTQTCPPPTPLVCPDREHAVEQGAHRLARHGRARPCSLPARLRRLLSRHPWPRRAPAGGQLLWGHKGAQRPAQSSTRRLLGAGRVGQHQLCGPAAEPRRRVSRCASGEDTGDGLQLPPVPLYMGGH